MAGGEGSCRRGGSRPRNRMGVVAGWDEAAVQACTARVGAASRTGQPRGHHALSKHSDAETRRWGIRWLGAMKTRAPVSPAYSGWKVPEVAIDAVPTSLKG